MYRLKSRFHFAFAEYHDPKRSSFGILRVMNDDLVQPARGFGTHPHGNMEICTYIVQGSLAHKDSMGTKETLGKT
jgi:redox-sensitive bicupin YhaK (pirin superfamily)